MIDEWTIEAPRDGKRYMVRHPGGVTMVGPQNLDFIHAPEGHVIFYVSHRTTTPEYEAIVKASFPDTELYAHGRRYAFITERDFALIKLAAS